jgi:hypothetical protein
MALKRKLETDESVSSMHDGSDKQNDFSESEVGAAGENRPETRRMKVHVRMFATGETLTFHLEPSTLLKCFTAAHEPCKIPLGSNELSKRIQKELDAGSVTGRLATLVLKGNPWTLKYVWAIVHEYLRFLELKLEAADSNGTLLSPSPLIDQLWHLHILDTQHYAADCNHIAQLHFPDSAYRFVHHSPHRTFDHSDVVEGRRISAKKAYVLRFGTIPDEAYWGTDAVPAFVYHECNCLTCQVTRHTGIDPRDMRMIFAGRTVEAGSRALGHNLSDGATLHVVVRMHGC